MSTQKAVVLKSFGGIENFYDDNNYPIPDLKDDYVRVRIKASSFNPVDYKIRMGNFGGNLPMVLGGDFSGVIEAVGKNVTRFKVSDEVYGLSIGFGIEHGANAETITITQHYINIKPKNLSFEEAAAVVITGMTAVHAANKVNLKNGQSALIVGASGGVGQIQVQLAKNSGAKVIALASEEGAKVLTSVYGLSPENIINYHGLSADQIKEKVVALTGGKGVNASFDLFGGHTAKVVCAESLTYGGHMVTIVEEGVKNSGYVPLYPVDSERSLFNHDASFHTIFVGARNFAPASEWPFVQEVLGQLTELYDSGKLKAPVIEVVGNLSAESTIKAHKLLEAHKAHKKLVMKH